MASHYNIGFLKYYQHPANRTYTKLALQLDTEEL